MRPRRTLHRRRCIAGRSLVAGQYTQDLPAKRGRHRPRFAFLYWRALPQVDVCTKLARLRITSRPESRRLARRGITGITWDERRPATGPSLARAIRLHSSVRGTVHGSHQRYGEVVQRREGFWFHLA